MVKNEKKSTFFWNCFQKSDSIITPHINLQLYANNQNILLTVVEMKYNERTNKRTLVNLSVGL